MMDRCSTSGMCALLNCLSCNFCGTIDFATGCWRIIHGLFFLFFVANGRLVNYISNTCSVTNINTLMDVYKVLHDLFLQMPNDSQNLQNEVPQKLALTQ